MQVAIIILAHKLPEQLALLTRALEHSQVRVYVHIDQRQRHDPFQQALHRQDVTLLPRHKSCWGDARVVDAAMEGIHAGTQDGCEYFLLISGQDFPLLPMGEIVAFFERNRATSYLRHWPVEQTNSSVYAGRDRTDFYSFTIGGRREICIPRGEDISYMGTKGRVLNSALRLWALPKGPRRAPSYVRTMRGDAWWNLSSGAARYVLNFLRDHPDYRTYHENTFAPDEVFVPSIVAGAGYAGAVEDESLRYIVPEPGFHPKTLMLEDLPALQASGKLFGRKFDSAVDRVVLNRLLEVVAPQIVY